MRLENKINRSWNSLVAGDIESAYKIQVGGGRLSKWQKELIRQADFLKTYDYPELINIKDKTRYEFALVASWNFLIEKNLSYEWAKIDNSAPILGNIFGLTVDINVIRDVLGHSMPISMPCTPEQCYEQWPELLTLPSLSLVTRSIFIRMIKYAQIGLGGLADTQVIANLDLPQTEQALFDLADAGLVKKDLTISELLMSQTLKELKQFAFDHSLISNGTKYQLVQSIVSTIDQFAIRKWFDFKNGKEFVYPLVSNLSLLKNYIWIESGILEDYMNWVHQTKCLNKTEQVILNERMARLNKSHYDPMEPWRPSLKDRKIRSVNHVWKSKNMLLLRNIWDSGCDLILKDIVQRYAWDWDINVEEAIRNYFIGDALLIYEKACNQNTFLSRFCEQRLEELNIEVRKPKLIICASCGIDFMDWSIDDRLSIRVGYKIYFCQHCYYSAFSDWGIGNQLVDKNVMLEQLSIVANILGVVPSSSFRRKLSLATLSEENQVILVKTLLFMPLQKKFVEVFGSWLQALVLAGVLENGTQRMSRGVRCIANDGHICNSLAEKTIDDWLYSHNIHHEKEPLYPYHFRLNPSRLRADWKVQNILIEFAGLLNEPDYAAKMKAKQEIAEEFGLSLMILEPEDILDLDLRLASLNKKTSCS